MEADGQEMDMRARNVLEELSPAELSAVMEMFSIIPLYLWITCAAASEMEAWVLCCCLFNWALNHISKKTDVQIN